MCLLELSWSQKSQKQHVYNSMMSLNCRDKFGAPNPYSSEIYGPLCINESEGQGLDSVYKWLAGLVSKVCVSIDVGTMGAPGGWCPLCFLIVAYVH